MNDVKWGWKKATTIFSAIVVSGACLGATTTVMAGTQGDSVEELRATIDQLKNTVLALEQKMDMIEDNQEATNKTIKEVAAKESTASASNLLLPENTTMKIYGYAKLDALWSDVSGAGETDLWVPGIPLDGTEAADQSDFRMHAKQSRLGLKTSTSTGWGDLNTVIEMDFFGQGGNQNMSNSSTLRLRKAYGELGHLRAGQDWSTFQVFTSFPETLDFAGPTGAVFNRQTLVRWTQKFEGGSWAIAAENPESRFDTGNGDEEYMPDFVARVDYNPGFGSWTLAAMARQLIIDQTINFGTDDAPRMVSADDDQWVYGINFAGSIPTFGKDSFGFNINYGDGIGRYMMLGYKDAYINPANGDIETFDQFGGFVQYRHFWMDNLRSTLCYSYGEADNDLQFSGESANDNLQSLHANLIWSPVSRVDIGFEYMWAAREIESGDDGELNRFQCSVKYNF